MRRILKPFSQEFRSRILLSRLTTCHAYKTPLPRVLPHMHSLLNTILGGNLFTLLACRWIQTKNSFIAQN